MSSTRTTEQVARKWHQCSLCGERIMAGTKYKRWRWFDGSDAGTVKVHFECTIEAMAYDWYYDPDGWPEEHPLIEERKERERERLCNDTLVRAGGGVRFCHNLKEHDVGDDASWHSDGVMTWSRSGQGVLAMAVGATVTLGAQS